jgi:Transcriptional Coactivator p15 (PC4)
MTQIEQGARVGDVPALGRRGVTLPEPIEWRFWKNRLRRDAIVVSLSTYENRNLISVRTYTTSQDGKMLPTAKGVAMAVERLPELAAALAKAVRKAKELGILADDGDGA